MSGGAAAPPGDISSGAFVAARESNPLLGVNAAESLNGTNSSPDARAVGVAGVAVGAATGVARCRRSARPARGAGAITSGTAGLSAGSGADADRLTAGDGVKLGAAAADA